MENRIILMLLNQLNRRKPLGKSIAFSIAFIIFTNIGLTTVRANEPIQPIDSQQSVNIKSSDRAFRWRSLSVRESFKSIVDSLPETLRERNLYANASCRDFSTAVIDRHRNSSGSLLFLVEYHDAF